MSLGLLIGIVCLLVAVFATTLSRGWRLALGAIGIVVLFHDLIMIALGAIMLFTLYTFWSVIESWWVKVAWIALGLIMLLVGLS